MSSTSSRIRAELQAHTGVDFATYADPELVDAVTGWSGLLGLGRDLIFGIGLGLAVAVTALVVALSGELTTEAGIGLVVGAVVAGAGTAAFTFGMRARSRVPDEATRLFDLTEKMADRVADDVAAGRLEVSATDAVRGLALVAAIPAMTRVAQRRFPLVGTLAAPAAGAVMTRALARVWPTGRGGPALAGVEGATQRLGQAVTVARTTVVPKLATAARWATLPLLVGGVVLISLGVAIAFLSLATA